MADMTVTDTTPDACCEPERQSTCCAPSHKADCCGRDEGCACDAGTPGIVRANKPSEHSTT